MSRRFDVFVSYSSMDKLWVQRLVADLERYGLSVWRDENDIRPGTRLIDAIEHGIEVSGAFIFVASPEAMASSWIKEEYNCAVSLAQHKDPPLPIIAALLREARLRLFLKSRRQVDFRDPTTYSARVAELVWGITGNKPERIIDLDPNALPLLLSENIPEPAALPPGSRMPIAPNKLFVGREAEFRKLAESLQVASTTAIGQVASVTGLGGIGKTQLAVEFAHRYGRFFRGGVFWMNFADAESVPAEVVQCGGPEHLGLWTIDGAPDIATQVARVRKVFAEPVPRLLIFDNCEDEKLLEAWRPTSGGCRVLVTCRRHEFSEHLGVRTLALDVLQRAESLALLRSFCRGQSFDPAEEMALNEICVELGDLPLALHLAGSFLARYRNAVKPTAYLTQLRDDKLLGHLSLQGKVTKSLPTQHELHVGRTFALSWDRLDPEHDIDVLAGFLLQCAACLAPGEPIPRALLVAMLGPPEGDPMLHSLARMP